MTDNILSMKDFVQRNNLQDSGRSTCLYARYVLSQTHLEDSNATLIEEVKIYNTERRARELPSKLFELRSEAKVLGYKLVPVEDKE